MVTITTRAVADWRPATGRVLSAALAWQAALLFLIGIELAVLAAWLPDTVLAVWRADALGDFTRFYDRAAALEPAGIYTPRLPLLLHPLTYLDKATSYQVYSALGIAAWVGVAYLAQRPVASLEGRAAVFIGVLALPQMHWAVRLGHLTPFLTLAATGGFLLASKRPVLAGVCFALLATKPQYAVIPVAFLLWRREWRAFGAFLVSAALLEIAAFLVVGFDALNSYVASVWDWGTDATDNRLPFQDWQYTWGGFLRSAGLEASPVLVLNFVALTAAVVGLVWWRGPREAAAPAAALGMLLAVPYANFYDWGLVAVAAVLLLRAELPWRGFLPVALLALFGALVASQAATSYPPAEGLLAEAGSSGIYWVVPAAFALLCALALLQPGRKDAGGETRLP